MVGSSGRRMLAIALPRADAWNVWFDLYGNTPEGFAARNAEVDAAAAAAGRDPAAIRRSACALVVVDPDAGERPVPPGVHPIEGGPDRVAAALRELGEAGADEVILVASPITERTVRQLGEAVALLR
jgi:alkanesulfonate monooxygenase SsuD/methylene tetrahydromethanopterin reductase-like flavin-dependent oxidoreductase (luciferase family)